VRDRGSHYVHGTEPEEQRRLSKLNDLLNTGSMRELGLRGGETILDLGCGLGQLTLLMARASRARILGIDRSEAQLAEARRQAAGDGTTGGRVEFRAGDVLDLRLSDREWGAFDVAHARFLLEHVPDPLAVVRAMVRAVRPGGRVVLEDEDHEILRLWPEPPGLREAWQAYIESYRRAGNDPHVGKRLVELLHQAGARTTRSTFISFGACSGDPLFPAVVDNIVGVLRGARASVLATEMIRSDAFEAVLEALRAWGARPDAAFWYAMAWAEGVKPER